MKVFKTNHLTNLLRKVIYRPEYIIEYFFYQNDCTVKSESIQKLDKRKNTVKKIKTIQ